MKIKALIVDDEPMARARVKRFLAGEPDIEVVGEAADGLRAVARIRELEPDLVFLDIQIPELDGFGVLSELGAGRLPAIVFVTAFDRYALRAFEVHALDYLLKPYDRERFRKSLARARAQLGAAGGALDPRILSLLESLKAGGPKFVERLVIKSGGRVSFLRAEEIDWVEAEGNYLRLHAGGETHLLRETMGRLEARLDPEKFLRIHRSALVRIERIKELQPMFGGDYTVILRDGTQLALSRGYRDRLLQLFANAS